MAQMDSASPAKGKAATRYQELSKERAPYLERARTCSSITIPTLIPHDDPGQGQDLPTLYQSVGANGVTNLASKLLLTMLPPNEPCFRLRVNNLTLEKEQEDMDKSFVSNMEKALSRIERAVLADIEATGDRPVVNEGNQHLIVGGNVLYHNDAKAGLRLFPLSRFVVERDQRGAVLEIVVEEICNLNTLPPELVNAIKEATQQTPGAPVAATSLGEAGGNKDKSEVKLYTHLTRTAERWHIYQECGGVELPESRGTYKLDACPWFAVRMYSVAGENYGRSFVELQLGDLISLESLKRSLVEGTAIVARVLTLVNPNGVTSARALAEAANGDVLEGNPNDVAFLQAQKGADFQVVATQVQELERSLKTAFLLMEGVRRNAERVTAEEIRVIAQELEMSLGGVYTVISQEFQLPYISSRMQALTKRKCIPQLPEGVVQPSIVTGFEALGRGNDKTKLVEFLSTCNQLLGPEQLMAFINPLNALTRLAAASGISTEGLVKDEETLQQEQAAAQQAQQQASMQEMAGKLGPEALRQVGNMAGQMMPGAAGGGGAPPDAGGSMPPQGPMPEQTPTM